MKFLNKQSLNFHTHCPFKNTFKFLKCPELLKISTPFKKSYKIIFKFFHHFLKMLKTSHIHSKIFFLSHNITNLKISETLSHGFPHNSTSMVLYPNAILISHH